MARSILYLVLEAKELSAEFGYTTLCKVAYLLAADIVSG